MNDSSSSSTKRDFIGEFVADISKALEEGTAPWCKPWKAGELVAPCNPVSGTTYSGINFVRLVKEGLADPRYMTYNGAKKAGFQVKKGEKGRPVVFWSKTSMQKKRDEQGQPIFDEKGKAILEEYQAIRPILQHTTVFHASQIEGIDPWEKESPKWAADERAEAILRNSGANISHKTRDKAYYAPKTDAIHLRPKSAFPTAGDYYSTALHELAHWTGHESRMNRTMGTKGTMDYAKEELRAEIAAWMMATKLGLPFDPEPHRSYVEKWSQIVKEEPKFLMQSCRDAEKICSYCLALAQNKDLTQEATAQNTIPSSNNMRGDRMAARDVPHIANKDIRLKVPYVQKEQASAYGAKWDKEGRTWYAPEGTNLTPLTKWLPKEQEMTPPQEERHERAFPTLSPEEEFAQALKSYGLDLKGELPVMDGEIHRVAVENGKAGAKDGSYVGHLDNRPAGSLTNFKTGEQVAWKYSGGHTISASGIAELSARNKILTEAREQARKARQEQCAQRCQEIWNQAAPLLSGHPYLVQKGVDTAPVRHSLKIDDKGNILVPMRDSEGNIHSLQTITQKAGTDNNTKRFAKDGKKQGMSHRIDPMSTFDKNPIVLAEGLATAASIHRATGLPVTCVFDAGNLLPVAQKMRELYPDKPIIIMADNDSQSKNNVGMQKAQVVQDIVDKVFICKPPFSEQEQKNGNTDFNDFLILHGVVKLQLAISQAFTSITDIGNAIRSDVASKIITVGERIKPALETPQKSQGMGR